MSDAVASACPTWPTLLAWLENDLPDEARGLVLVVAR